MHVSLRSSLQEQATSSAPTTAHHYREPQQHNVYNIMTGGTSTRKKHTAPSHNSTVAHSNDVGTNKRLLLINKTNFTYKAFHTSDAMQLLLIPPPSGSLWSKDNRV